MENLEGAILVGGLSRRMGRDKSTLRLGGRSMLERIAAAMSPLVHRVRVVGGSEKDPPQAGNSRQEDIYPNSGPLSGIHAALATAELHAVLVVGCDLPFVTESFLHGLASGLTGEFEAVVPRQAGGRPVSVCAVYRVSCLATLEKRMRRGELAARDFVSSLRTRWIEGEELERLDPKGICLKNINTPADYEEAQRIAAEE